jgi:DNA repair protein RadC
MTQHTLEIHTAESAFRAVQHLETSDIEEFWALALGPTKALLQSKMIFRGTVDACLVHPRDVFRFACLSNASSLIVAHNHPSGDATPSEQDLIITRQLLRASDIVEIPLLDHLIVAGGSYTSLAREGWCRFGNRVFTPDWPI